MSGYLTLLGIFVFLIAFVSIVLIKREYGSFKNARAYWATNDGKNVPGGIKMFGGFGLIFGAVSIALIFLFFPQEAESSELKPKPAVIEYSFFNYAEVFLGVDKTFDPSPQCHTDQHSDRLTSNGGVKLNAARITYKRIDVEINGKYQHHSCAFSQDALRYDSLGIEFVWRINFK